MVGAGLAVLSLLMDALPPLGSERAVREAAIRSLIQYYFTDKSPEKGGRGVLCLAIDEAAVVADPLADDEMPTDAMLEGKDDDAPDSYLRALSGVRVTVVPLSECPKPLRRGRDGPVLGHVTVRLRPARWVGMDTVEIPTIVISASRKACTDIRVHRYVWMGNGWREKPFIFMQEQCPY